MQKKTVKKKTVKETVKKHQRTNKEPVKKHQRNAKASVQNTTPQFFAPFLPRMVSAIKKDGGRGCTNIADMRPFDQEEEEEEEEWA